MRVRLDQLLVTRGLAPTRSQARDLVVRGCVSLAGVVVRKAGITVAADAAIAVVADAQPYVSRGGLKLAAALDAFGFDPAGRVALDVGASTGGFTDVLLRRGAARVVAIDVGHGQLHPSLTADPRVTSLENQDIREIDPAILPEGAGAISADVSFVSLSAALPAALALAAPGAWLAALVKPQFEVGRADIGKGGIVRDDAARQRALDNVSAWLSAQPGWRVTGTIPSPVAGGSGNAEFLIGAQFHG